MPLVGVCDKDQNARSNQIPCLFLFDHILVDMGKPTKQPRSKGGLKPASSRYSSTFMNAIASLLTHH